MKANYASQVRELLERLAEHRVVGVAREAFDAAQGSLVRAAARAPAASPAAVQARLTAGQHTVAAQLAGDLDAALRDVHTESLRALQRLLGKMQKGEATPLDDPFVYQRVLRRHSRSTHGSLHSLLTKWSHEVGAVVDRAVTAARLEGITAKRALARVAEEAAEAHWWKVERIARTEAAFAFNATQQAAVEELAVAWPDVMKRWTELVNDATGQPLDPRVAPDSMVLHGQLVVPAGVFTMPADPRVSAKTVGKQWAFPPNRPNDRAVVTPWRPGWGVPGYVLRGGRRVALRR